jgi:hypothetical protein
MRFMGKWSLAGLAALVGIVGAGLLSTGRKDIDADIKLGVTTGLVVETPKKVEYDERFSRIAKGTLQNKLEMEPEIANSYDKTKFKDGYGVLVLARNGVLPDIANPLGERLDSWDIVALSKGDVTDPSIVNSYVEKFYSIGGKEIAHLVNSGSSARITEEWRKYEFKVSGKYDIKRSFSFWQIGKLHEAGKNPMDVAQYDQRFSPTDVYHLVMGDISAQESDKYMDLNSKYGSKIGGEDISRYKEEGISFIEVREQARKNWFEASVGH